MGTQAQDDEAAEEEIFKFKCDECGQRIETTADRVGNSVNCPGCRTPLTVPEAPSSLIPSDLEIPAQTRVMAQDEFRGAATESDSGPSTPLSSGPLPTSEIPKADCVQYKVVPLALTAEETSSAISVARKLERLINAFAIDGWRLSQVETVNYETKGALGSKEELAQMVILERD